MVKKILLVDEHPETRYVVSRWLLRTGYHVVTVASFKEGLRHCGTEHFDLLIGDLTGSDTSRYDLLQELGKHCKIQGIAYLGSANETDVTFARKAGFDAYLLKPIEFFEVVNKVSMMIGDGGMLPTVFEHGSEESGVAA